MDEITSLILSHGKGGRPVAGHVCLDLVNSHVNASTDNLRQALLASLAVGGGTVWAMHRHVTTRGPHWGRCLHAAAKRWRLRHWREDWRRRSLFRPGLGLHLADVGASVV